MVIWPSTFLLKGGKPLNVVVGTSDDKGKRETSINPFSGEDMVELQADIDAPNTTMEKFMKVDINKKSISSAMSDCAIQTTYN